MRNENQNQPCHLGPLHGMAVQDRGLLMSETSNEWKDRVMRLLIERDLAIEKVIKASMLKASTDYAVKAEDPGWEAEMYEEMLIDAIKEASGAISSHREAKIALEMKR